MIVDAQGAQDRIRVATALLQAAADHGVTLAIAESLTGGQVSSSLVEVPGASRVLVGTVVAYATRIKAQLLGADVGLATTGVAGPGPADGHPAGTVHVAVVAPWGQRHRELHLGGDRSQIRCATVMDVCELAVGFLRNEGCVPRS